MESTSMAVDRLNALNRPQDQQMLRSAGESVRKVESSVQDVLVAYKPRHDSEMRRVGVPLVSSESGLGLAYDLSGVPAANRESVVAAWHTTPDDGYSVSGMQGVCAVWSGRPYLASYTLQARKRR